MTVFASVLAVAGIAALYGLAARATWRWADRVRHRRDVFYRHPGAGRAVQVILTAIGAVYAPVWVPVWAVRRWINA